MAKGKIVTISLNYGRSPAFGEVFLREGVCKPREWKALGIQAMRVNRSGRVSQTVARICRDFCPSSWEGSVSIAVEVASSHCVARVCFGGSR